MELEERIIELEMRIAHQDRTIADLDDVVREFADRVTALERVVEELRESTRGSDEIGPGDEPPPHY
jgi:SlyX protein